ncbi:LOW QUALITY PROTEIN: hypothetical protein ACHAW5_006533 [Stephanodiscus triporus]|uniref:Uncharacterized protein n=1 Tax=Stephanodiscus triporus TaxID=2934178 RepID=A0ABD3P9Y2_9STRA
MALIRPSALARKMLEDSTGIYRDYENHHKPTIWLMKVGGLLSMTACNFIMRDVLIRYNKGERIRLTHLIVFEVNTINIRSDQALICPLSSYVTFRVYRNYANACLPILNGKLSFAVFWGSFFSPFMSTWMGLDSEFRDFFFHSFIYTGMSALNSVRVDTDIYLAAGSIASCTAQGFLDAFFYGSAVFMNAILAFTHCVMVKRGRKDEATGSLWIVLVLPPLICFLLAILPLFDRAYNPTGFHVCGIAEYPLGCIHPLNPYSCERGINARVLSIFRFAFIFIGHLTIVVSVSILIHHIISRERRMKTNPGDIANNSSIKATWQGISYVAAFMFSWGPWYIWQWIRITSGMRTISTDGYLPLYYLISITHPLQGVGIAVVYFRPRYLKFRDRDNEELRLSSALRSLDLPVPSILTSEWWRTLCSKSSSSDGSKRCLDDRVIRRDSKNDTTSVIVENSNNEPISTTSVEGDGRGNQLLE